MKVDRHIIYITVLVTAFAIATVGLEMRTDSPVDDSLTRLHQEITQQEWQQAEMTVTALKQMWKKRRAWVAFNNSSLDVQAFDRALTQVESYVAFRDQTNAAAQAAVLKTIWHEFGG